ncbi:MAG: acyl--CoA ligase [Gammaproteobacteria bacterium]|jgi:acyl-CoA synthetase (AMP-forming)/AMP-acid ligase II|nr:acyl--CoA ligase [Gammaproteobacteria bacterium]MBT3860772.1 acyl--CoA ligase [Gammaproteobacteria bacterium]MBT3986973.1 acyl--CoA ligase [Gammaproteobacteria bacterium]MBT4257092.1 acyl--CoA ligase [Gammaproteobacteria bacterium]MBT4582046.1 acyl--CoA ligase [Gammaproteobacteria bacterium]
MLTDEQILQDLEKLKTIAADHKAVGSEYETETATIAGLELDVFKNIPENLGELYRKGLVAGDKDFLVYQNERFSFEEAFDLARRMARVLLEQFQVKPGDSVAVCARNSPEWCISYMAISLMGAIVVPMNSWWKGPELKYGLNDSGSKLIFIDPARLSLLEPFLGELNVEIVQIKPELETVFPEFYELAKSVEPLSDEEVERIGVKADDNATIMYTSGSTGMPKGVLSSHRSIISALYTWKFVKEINEILRPELVEENPEFDPALLANVPLFHVTGSHAQFLASFVYLRKFVMMYKWDAEVALKLIEEERISVFHGVPTMAWELMQSPNFDSTDISSLRGVQSGGAPRPPEHLNMIMEKFPDKAIPGLGYGLTETNAIGAIISGKFYASRPDSTGRPTPPVTSVKIVDEQDNELSLGEIGEICIKGPTVMKGYWNNPEATAEVIKDGWFRTGDIGKQDDLGFLIILDRAKDIVIRGGENIGCAEVEYAITEHPDVNEVSVYGIPDDRLGEIVCASIMIKSDNSLDSHKLQAFLQSRIAAFKIPERMFFQYEQLPRIATGKIAKKELRKKTIESLGLSLA